MGNCSCQVEHFIECAKEVSKILGVYKILLVDLHRGFDCTALAFVLVSRPLFKWSVRLAGTIRQTCAATEVA